MFKLRAISASYSRENQRIVVQFNSGVDVSFPPATVQGLEKVASSELEAIEISPSGFGIHFPLLDVDIYLPALLKGFCGSPKWMASRLGQAGGKSRSVAKRAAARANGKLGGRPKRKNRAS